LEEPLSQQDEVLEAGIAGALNRILTTGLSEFECLKQGLIDVL
jgi:hypothetical protein